MVTLKFAKSFCIVFLCWAFGEWGIEIGVSSQSFKSQKWSVYYFVKSRYEIFDDFPKGHDRNQSR